MSQVSIKLTPRDIVGLPYAPSNNANTILLFQQFFKGDQGIQGIQGKSAYQVWLDDGHTGTPEDFINDIDPNLINAALDAIAARDAMVKPSIDLNLAENKYTIYDSFANSYVEKALGDILTIDNGAATGFDAVGLLSTSAEDSARLVFDPVTGKSLGLLHEASANNASHSSEFDNAVWAKRSGSTIVADAWYAKDGTLSGDKHENTDTTTNGTYIGRTSAFALDNKVYCVHYSTKRGSQPICGIQMYSKLNNSSYCILIFNFDTLEVTITNYGSVSGAIGGVIDEGDGVYRVWMSANMLTGTNVTGARFVPSVWGLPASIGSEYGYIADADIVEGNYPSSHIPTAGSAVTRLVDKYYRTLGNEFNPREGTLIFKGILHAINTSSGSGLLVLSDDTNNNRIQLYFTTEGKIGIFVVSAGVASVNTFLGSSIVNQPFTAALSYKSDSCILSINGTHTEDNTVVLPSGLNQLAIGRRASGLTDGVFSGTIARARYIPRWHNADDLNAITVEGVAA